MVYFEDGDLYILAQDEKETLIAAASPGRDFPSVEIVSHQLVFTPREPDIDNAEGSVSRM